MKENRVLPYRLTGRLAAVYRLLRRADDEVRLLERFHESQSDPAMQTRFSSRLSKARAVAMRQTRSRSSETSRSFAASTLRGQPADAPRARKPRQLRRPPDDAPDA